MPAASTAPARSRRAAPKRASAKSATPRAARVRWDRLGRVAMMGVMVALVYLYLSAGIRLRSTLHEAHRNSALVSTLERQNKALRAQHASLGRRATLVREARQLGMDKPGEQPYVLQGLPPN